MGDCQRPFGSRYLAVSIETVEQLEDVGGEETFQGERQRDTALLHEGTQPQQVPGRGWSVKKRTHVNGVLSSAAMINLTRASAAGRKEFAVSV